MSELTIDQGYDLAVQHHRAGRMAEAESLCRQLLTHQPSHADALHLLGRLAYDAARARTAEALRLLRHLVERNPGSTEYLHHLGLTLWADGRLDEAAVTFHRAAFLRSDFADAHNSLGSLLESAGRTDAAIAALQQAVVISPSFAEAQKNLATLLWKRGRRDEAIGAYRQVAATRPGDPATLFDLGNALQAVGRIDEAIVAYRRAITLRPDIAEAHNNLGALLKQKLLLEESIAACRRALDLRPDYAEAWNNLGEALRESGQLRGATDAYRKALELRPDLAEAHNNLANLLAQQNKPDEAAAAYRQALALRPDLSDTWFNLANVLSQQGNVDEATEAYRKALGPRPNYPEARSGLGMMLLLQGQYVEGFAAYESRFDVPEFAEAVGRPSFSGISWDGRDLAGRQILLHAEQGAGDTIQFVRYAPLVQARGGRVIVLCPPSVARLLTGQRGIDQVVTSVAQAQPFDVHCPLMSLPRVFGTTLATVPNDVPYLFADPSLTEAWRARTRIGCGGAERGSVTSAAETPGPSFQHPTTQPRPHSPLRVGLAWSGNVTNPANAVRSMHLSALAPLGDVPGVCFFSLQKGPPGDQALDPPPGMQLVDRTADLHDFADTAALIANLDLVITTDTSVAHLAGAMGKRVWVLLSAVADWRWLLGRHDSPWYPTMSLFRQPTAGDWETPVREVAAELRRRMKDEAGSDNLAIRGS